MPQALGLEEGEETGPTGLPSSLSLNQSQGPAPHPPQRPGQGLVERPIGSGVTMCDQVTGQRFADSSLEGIDLMGEVTEL